MIPPNPPPQPSGLDESQRIAAIKIEDAWIRRRKNTFDADSRWADAAIHAKLQASLLTNRSWQWEPTLPQMSRIAAEEGKNDSKSRWRRAAFLANRLQDDDRPIRRSSDKSAKGMSKTLETQHWLELTDRWENHQHFIGTLQLRPLILFLLQ